MEKAIRLDKFLADMGRGTRSQMKDAIRKGRVTVNEATVKSPEIKVTPGTDRVAVDHEPVGYVFFEYYLLHKPAGVVSATEDSRYRTVIDLIETKNRKDLFPVGRLDLDTEGLLLITNDGELSHRLLSPKKHVDKVYFARCEGTVPKEAEEAFAKGLLLPDGFRCLPASLEILKQPADGETVSEVRLTIKEGKFHQVKRMMESVGCPVIYLKRLSMGPLKLDETLLPGQYRKLTEEELKSLMEPMEKENT